MLKGLCESKKVKYVTGRKEGLQMANIPIQSSDIAAVQTTLTNYLQCKARKNKRRCIMRSSLSCHLKSISGLLIVIFSYLQPFLFAELQRLKLQAYPNMQKPYVEELTESIPFDYDDYTKPIKRDEFARLIYFAIKQMSDAMTTKVVLNDAAPPFSDTDDVFVGALSNAGIIMGRNDENLFLERFSHKRRSRRYYRKNI